MAIYSLPTGFEARMSLKSSYSQEARLRQVDFGDGYIQRTPLGLNSLRRSMDVSWENLLLTDFVTLIQTLDFVQKNGHAIAITQNYLLPLDGNFVIESLDVQPADDTHFTVTVSLTEVFDL